jgi:hypothetical protein
MENEFVSYTQALALKELGFDEECLGLYRDGSLELKKNTGGYYNNSWINKFDKPTICTAPLYQQAFRWMREKHLTYGIIIPTNVSKIQGIDCILEIHPPPDKHGIVYILEDGKLYTSYEEAESACLDKLIEACKIK